MSFHCVSCKQYLANLANKQYLANLANLAICKVLQGLQGAARFANLEFEKIQTLAFLGTQVLCLNWGDLRHLKLTIFKLFWGTTSNTIFSTYPRLVPKLG